MNITIIPRLRRMRIIPIMKGRILVTPKLWIVTMKDIQMLGRLMKVIVRGISKRNVLLYFKSLSFVRGESLL